MHYIVEDTETGGLYPALHAILSIGAVCSWNAEHFYIHITPESQPGKIVDPEAVKKNGYTAEKWKGLGAVPLDIGFGRFLGWLAARRAERKHASLWCHNLAFDRGFLSEAERIIGHSIPHRHDWRCSQSKLGELMDKGIVPRGSGGLDRLIELSDYPTPRTEEHDALEDCHATLHGIRWMLEKEKGADNTLRQLYANSLTERRRLEAILIRVGEWMVSKSSWDECGEIARLLSEESTRLKKEEGRADG
jgi:DNA polymerase III epsilon subunit-like protein